MRIEWPNTIKDDPEFKLWLEKYVFPYDGFESAAFEASNTIYEIRLQESLLEDAVHRGITPLGISEKSLNDALLQAVKETFQDESSNWFHVNVHDGSVRIVEKIGRYRYTDPLVPIYILLNHHQAEQAGITYAGIASMKQRWLLLFENGLHISIHGSEKFVNSFKHKLSII